MCIRDSQFNNPGGEKMLSFDEPIEAFEIKHCRYYVLDASIDDDRNSHRNSIPVGNLQGQYTPNCRVGAIERPYERNIVSNFWQFRAVRSACVCLLYTSPSPRDS